MIQLISNLYSLIMMTTDLTFILGKKIERFVNQIDLVQSHKSSLFNQLVLGKKLREFLFQGK